MTRFCSSGMGCTPRSFATIAVACIALTANPAHAETWTEGFEESFASWENEWLGQYSNMQNYYVVAEGKVLSYQGNNPGGLYLSDGYALGTQSSIVNILFDPTFGGQLTSISFALASYASANLTIFDISGNTLFSGPVSPFGDAYNDPGSYATYGATSSNGIGGFSLVGTQPGLVQAQVEGNFSIDNVVAQRVLAAVPEPSTWAMMLFGFGAVGYSLRRRRRAIVRLPAIG